MYRQLELQIPMEKFKFITRRLAEPIKPSIIDVVNKRCTRNGNVNAIK